jgi:hypothetical protein
MDTDKNAGKYLIAPFVSICIIVRENFVFLHKLFPGGVPWRSADLQSAVSPNCIRQNVVPSDRIRFGYGRRITNPRYSRMEFCATSVAAQSALCLSCSSVVEIK